MIIDKKIRNYYNIPWSRILVLDDGCWGWVGAIGRGDYGCWQGRSAHLVIYEMVIGLVPVGLELDHTCRRRNCVNPEHLEPVTHKENIWRGLEQRGKPQPR